MKQKREKIRFRDYVDYRDGEDSDRPSHQLDRGPRHGNNRDMYAKEKVKERRRERAAEKRAHLDY